MKALNAKACDKQFNEYLTRLIYAALADIDNGWNGEERYSSLLYQHHDNLIKKKGVKLDGLKSRFTISDATRQFLTFMFGKMVTELKNIQLESGDTSRSIRAKLTEAHVDCYSEFMFNLKANIEDRFEAVLKADYDPKLWFHNQLVGRFPEHEANKSLIGLIYDEFNGFLKALAWMLAKFITYHPTPISGELFMGFIAQQGMSQIMLDEMQSCLRAKPPARPRKKKSTSTDSTSTNSTSADSTSTGSTSTQTVASAVTEILSNI